MANPDGRLTNYMMGWTVGMPMETHLSITAMVLGGAFDRLPAELKICFAHGGAFNPRAAVEGCRGHRWRRRPRLSAPRRAAAHAAREREQQRARRAVALCSGSAGDQTWFVRSLIAESD